MEEKECHYSFEPDERFIGLEVMFKAFNKALNVFVTKGEKYNGYYADFYFDETELIYGVLLLSLQNYINKSCADFLEVELLNCKEAYQLYDKGSKVVIGDVTQIRLIIALANYFKHKDGNDKLHEHTIECLRKADLLKFSEKEESECEDTLIIEGLFLLIKDLTDVSYLLQIVKEWRTSILDLCHELRRKALTCS
jgi:hypothetical protein